MDKPTGGNAFPTPENGTDGMVLRDYFAGQALNGILACPVEFEGMREVAASTLPNLRARIAYAHADAMIAERSK